MTLLHQTRQTELAVGSGEWLLAVIGAVAVQPPLPVRRLLPRERRAFLEGRLHASGLAYGIGAVDAAIELDPMATPGARAFAHFVAGLLRLCACAGALAESRYFLESDRARDRAAARRPGPAADASRAPEAHAPGARGVPTNAAATRSGESRGARGREGDRQPATSNADQHAPARDADLREPGRRDADQHALARDADPYGPGKRDAEPGGRASETAAVAPDVAVQARRAQLLAVLAAVGGEARAAAQLFADPLGDPARQARLAGRIAPRLARRYLSESGPFAGLPLHNGLCAIEVRTCVTLALASFGHGRISPAATAVAGRAALGWRALLVELLAGLARVQSNGKESLKGIDQVLRSQRLPPREARLLRRSLLHPRELEALAPALHSEALRKFALTQVLLGALVDRHFEAGEVAFVERLAAATSVSGGDLAALEVEVDDFYRRNKDALAALQLAATPEGLPHALTTRLEAAVRDNLDRILQEIRETGELAELLAKASVGGTLSAAEKAKVREQLIDLAKTIPALAIFAAPGGLLLLPILLKLLPFSLLPSSFVDPPPQRPALPEPRRRAGS